MHRHLIAKGFNIMPIAPTILHHHISKILTLFITFLYFCSNAYLDFLACFFAAFLTSSFIEVSVSPGGSRIPVSSISFFSCDLDRERVCLDIGGEKMKLFDGVNGFEGVTGPREEMKCFILSLMCSFENLFYIKVIALSLYFMNI